MTTRDPTFLVITGHDFAASLRTSTHFIIEELAKIGQTRVFSAGFSRLTDMMGVPSRKGGGTAFNKAVMVNGVEVYALKTVLTPFNPRVKALTPLSKLGFKAYASALPKIVQQWAIESTTIIVESGIPPVFLERIKYCNPDATIIYRAMDDLNTIGCDPYLSEALEKATPDIAWAALPSKFLATCLPKGIKKYNVTQGVDTTIVDRAGPSPFLQPQHRNRKHAVSIGSMLFDSEFFKVAVNAFPDITFHIIGSRKNASELPSAIAWYPEMPFDDLLAFMKYADFGIAPYRAAPNAEYLRDTSLKLIQYGMFGLPAVCPHFAAKDRPLRIGYTPGDESSIIAAIQTALEMEDRQPVHAQSWTEVTRHVIQPREEDRVSA